MSYSRVSRTLSQMKGCLASGYPFVFGFTVYDSFESAEVAKTGVVPMPAPRESVLGGHAVLAVGYDDGQQRFIVRNSWGTGWGMQGYFTIPYAYLTDRGLASDFWTIRLIRALTRAGPRAPRPRVAVTASRARAVRTSPPARPAGSCGGTAWRCRTRRASRP